MMCLCKYYVYTLCDIRRVATVYYLCEVDLILVTMALTTDKVSCMGISLTSTSDIRSLYLRQLVARVSGLTLYCWVATV